MKLYSNPITSAALVALLVTLSPGASAQTQSQTSNQSIDDAQRLQQDQQRQMQQQQQQPLRKQSANDLTGMNLKNRNGDSLGRVKDFVIDSSSGQVAFAVIGSGGVLGIGETLHAVPVSALNYEAVSGDERLTLDIDSARWAQAPRFRKDRISSLLPDQEGRSTYEYYGQTWQGASQSLSMQQPPAPQTDPAAQQSAQQQQQSQLVMATDIIGKNLRSGTQEVGEVEDVLIQLQNRTAAVLLDPEDSFTGTDSKYVVPFNKLTLVGTETFSTSLSREDFSSAQVAQGDSWANRSGGGSLFIWPGMTSTADRVAQDASQAGQRAADRVAQTGERAADRIDQTGERVAQGMNQPAQTVQGQPPVAEIRRVLQSDTTIAQQGGRNVQVIAEGNRVVLLGTVQSEQAKDQIENRVEQAAPGWNVDNQIRVATAEE